MPSRVPNLQRPAKPLTLIGLAACGVLASAFLGGTTNAVNGYVSPTYFINVLGWKSIADVWSASIAQGILEGFLFGVFFSLVFTVGTGIITEGACPFGFAFKHLLGILAGVYVCWALGGLAGMGLAALSPEFFRQTFIGVPATIGPMIAYAWVGGSIWGAEIGGLVSVVIGLVLLRNNWRRRTSWERDLPSQPERSGNTSSGPSDSIATPSSLGSDLRR
jgi:hypothetical protein